MDTLIIGGVAGGAAATARLRRNDEIAAIVHAHMKEKNIELHPDDKTTQRCFCVAASRC